MSNSRVVSVNLKILFTTGRQKEHTSFASPHSVDCVIEFFGSVLFDGKKSFELGENWQLYKGEGEHANGNVT